MFKYLLRILISFLTFAFFDCKQDSKESNIEKAVLELTSRFRQLQKVSGSQAKYYKLIRSVTIGGKEIEIQLRSAPDTLNDPQEIVLFINQNKEVYGIPLFSNTYHDYWNFEFDSILSAVKPVNTTFEKELKNCLNALKFLDNSGTAANVIDELLLSVLQCKRLSDGDSLDLSAITMNVNNNLAIESTDSCFLRLRKNWIAISKEFHPNDIVNIYNSFYDSHNGRIYQFDFKQLNREKMRDCSLKTYRQDCISAPFMAD